MSEEIRIGKKSKSKYISSCLFAFNDGHQSVTISALGGQVSKAFDVAEKLCEITDDIAEAKTTQFEKDGLLGVRIEVMKDGQRPD